MDYWNTEEQQTLSAATSNSQPNAQLAFERESSAHAAAPLITGPLVGMPPTVTGPITTGPAPMPLQYPLTPSQYPSYYAVPMTMPYPMMRMVDQNGNAVDPQYVRFFPPPFFPRPFFYPRPFFPPFAPPFFPPFFI